MDTNSSCLIQQTFIYRPVLGKSALNKNKMNDGTKPHPRRNVADGCVETLPRPVHPSSTCFGDWLPRAPTYLSLENVVCSWESPSLELQGGLFPPPRCSPQPMAVWLEGEKGLPPGLWLGQLPDAIHPPELPRDQAQPKAPPSAPFPSLSLSAKSPGPNITGL